ncbi:MAG: hypothetical protein ABI298_05070 [Acidimicrobiales bacterium]
MSDGCDLCEGAQITTRYFEDDLCWIADCEICLVPIVVWREHDASPSDEVKERLVAALTKVADEEIGEGQWSLDDPMRNIPDHYHAHARPPYFSRRGGAG